MSTKYFNFNHEADLTPVEMNDETGQVTFTMNDISQSYDSMEEFAEMYARARNVLPENLKNWDLQQDGDSYSYVLHAGTAGVDLTNKDIDELAASLSAQGYTFTQINQITNSLQHVEGANPSTPEPKNDYGEDLTSIIEDLENDEDYASDLAVLKFAYRNPNEESDTDEDDAEEDNQKVVFGFLTEDENDEIESSAFIDWISDQLTRQSTDTFAEYEDNYDEYDYDADDVDEDDLEHAYYGYLTDEIRSIANSKRHFYEEAIGMPMTIILNLATDNYTEYSTAFEAFNQAKLAAFIAHRKVAVQFINVTKELTEDNQIVNYVSRKQYKFTDYVNTPNEYSLYYLNHNFYAIKEQDGTVND